MNKLFSEFNFRVFVDYYKNIVKIIQPYINTIQKAVSPITQPIKSFIGPYQKKFDNFKEQNPKTGLAITYISRLFLIGFTTLFLIVTLTALGLFGEMPNKEELRNIENSQASEIYTADSILIGKFYIENRTEIKLENISPYVITALLAVEDKRFFEHSG
ncbi:MAG TPA: transglycosylase domain-containing protein, partial [Saprospiraceae bacterium]|nr:transglycosylase domain-containing protein [Saprospiraceae bacterium]